MKNKFAVIISLTLIISVLSVLILSLSSCEADDDNNPSPVPDVRNKFIGEWNVSDACNKANYKVTISKDPSNSAQVLLENFAGSQAVQPDTAIVAANNIMLYQQYNSEGWRISGSGDYNVDGSLSWVFFLRISGHDESCTATYVMQ